MVTILSNHVRSVLQLFSNKANTMKGLETYRVLEWFVHGGHENTVILSHTL